MTIEDIEAVLERVTYRPGWKIRILPPEGPFHYDRALYLLVEARVEDTFNPGREVRVWHQRPVLPPDLIRDEEHFLYLLRRELGQVECHERDEWLRVDGEMKFNPH